MGRDIVNQEQKSCTVYQKRQYLRPGTLFSWCHGSRWDKAFYFCFCCQYDGLKKMVGDLSSALTEVSSTLCGPHVYEVKEKVPVRMLAPEENQTTGKAELKGVG